MIGEVVRLREINAHLNPHVLKYVEHFKGIAIRVTEKDVESIHLRDTRRMRELFTLSPDAVIPKMGKVCRLSKECSSYEKGTCDLKEKVKKKIVFRPCWEYPTSDDDLCRLMGIVHEAWCNRRVVLLVV